MIRVIGHLTAAFPTPTRFAASERFCLAVLRPLFVCVVWLLLLLSVLIGVPLQADEPPARAAPKKAAPKVAARLLQVKLLERTDLKVDKVPLNEVVKTLSERFDIVIRLDEAGLKRAGVAPDVPISADFKNFTLNAALQRILSERNLRHRIEDGAIVISDGQAEAAAAEAERVRVAAEKQAVDLAAAAALNLQEQQFQQQFRPILRAEIAYIRKVCQPTDEQLRNLADEGERHLKSAVKKYAELQARMQNGRWRATDRMPDLRTLIREGMAGSVGSHLSVEQAALYRDEIEKRIAQRRQVIVRNIVARLDQDLGLSAEQRDKLVDSLGSHWNDAWGTSLEAYLYSNNSLPQIPDQFVAPLLNDAQKKLWRAMPKAGAGIVHFDINNPLGNNILGIPPLDTEPFEGPAAGAAEAAIRQ